MAESSIWAERGDGTTNGGLILCGLIRFDDGEHIVMD